VSLAYLETGFDLGEAEEREVRLADAELGLRLDGAHSTRALTVILEEALACADTVNVVRARIALGVAASARGDHPEAIAQLEQVIASGQVTPRLRPDVYAALGESCALGGDPARAVELFESVLDELEQAAPHEPAARVRFSTYLSYALTDLGELERANSVVEDALRLAEETSGSTDPYTRVRLYWSLGRIAHEQSRPLDALDQFRRAVALLETTEDTVNLARAYLSCAAAMLASGKGSAETAPLIEKAERLLGTSPEPRYHADIHRLKAMVAIRAGDCDEAELQAREAQALAAELPNQSGLATWVLADALAGRDDARAAECYAEAMRLLRQHGTPREQLQLFRAYAKYLRAHGRGDEAFDLLEEATTLASHLRGTRATTHPANLP
jgi:tetratricopeptide (TPR) repeat protein